MLRRPPLHCLTQPVDAAEISDLSDASRGGPPAPPRFLPWGRNRGPAHRPEREPRGVTAHTTSRDPPRPKPVRLPPDPGGPAETSCRRRPSRGRRIMDSPCSLNSATELIRKYAPRVDHGRSTGHS